MLWVLGIFGLVILVMSYLGIRTEKSNQRRELDPVYDAKVTAFWGKINPYWNFTEKVFHGIFLVLVIYYIYLG